MALVAAKCTSCGANVEVDPSQNVAICEYCGKYYAVKKAINNYSEVNVNNNADSQANDVRNIFDVRNSRPAPIHPIESAPIWQLILGLLLFPISALMLFGGLPFAIFSLICWIFDWFGLGIIHIVLGIIATIVGFPLICVAAALGRMID